MLEAAKMGAYIEFVYNGLIGSYKEFHVQRLCSRDPVCGGGPLHSLE